MKRSEKSVAENPWKTQAFGLLGGMALGHALTMKSAGEASLNFGFTCSVESLTPETIRQKILTWVQKKTQYETINYDCFVWFKDGASERMLRSPASHRNARRRLGGADPRDAAAASAHAPSGDGVHYYEPSVTVTFQGHDREARRSLFKRVFDANENIVQEIIGEEVERNVYYVWQSGQNLKDTLFEYTMPISVPNQITKDASEQIERVYRTFYNDPDISTSESNIHKLRVNAYPKTDSIRFHRVLMRAGNLKSLLENQIEYLRPKGESGR